ncbi:hypothetical protein [Limisphaera sp. VF-2]|uniref:hypothetical protein n=1 Tax=Limisphaera sp. VF-2 TaxID=3400418 RepID=UPI00176ED98B
MNQLQELRPTSPNPSSTAPPFLRSAGNARGPGRLWAWLSAAFLLLGSGGSWPGRAAEFGISGIVELGASLRRWTSTNLTAWGDRMEYLGPNGELSVARYHADLASGRMGTYVRGYKPPVDFVNPAGAGGYALVECWDRLRFTIPAGSYPSGIVATLRGRLTGNLAAVGRAGINYSYASQYALVVFQGAGSPPGSDCRWAYNVSVVPEQSPRTVSEAFAVSTWLAMPGDNYPLPRTRQVSFAARLEAWASAASWTPRGQSADGVSDFGGSVQLLAVECPPGVTWTSDSGVFLTLFPEPAPRLTVRRVAPDLLELAWSTNWADCALEWTPQLSSPIWAPVTNAASLLGDRYTVTLPPEFPASFFRLRVP